MRIEHKYKLQYSVGDTLVLKENGVKVSIEKKAGIVKGCEKYGRLVPLWEYRNGKCTEFKPCGKEKSFIKEIK